MPNFNFTTGPTTLPDVGELSYNGCVFGPLFETQVSGVFVKDDAGRTTKVIEYTITVDGYVTLPEGQESVESVLNTLETLLSKQAGALVYSGRGIRIAVNAAGTVKDAAWGPVPEVLDITPLGGGRSAKIKWTVKTRIPPKLPRGTTYRLGQVLQFNYETVVSYDEDGYSRFSLSGVVEIPMTRDTVNSRSITRTADDFRNKFPGDLLATVDLEKFRPVKREFKVSKDKRLLEFSVEFQENTWMATPPNITIARGQFNVKPVKAGAGLTNWMCTLSATYTVAKGEPRRLAWLAFLALLRTRMKAGDAFGNIQPPDGNQQPNPGPVAGAVVLFPQIAIPLVGIDLARRILRIQQPAAPRRKVWLIDFNISEGLYADAKTVTFSATWRLVTTFSTILLASGLWRKAPGHTEAQWALSVRSISGYSSWLENKLDPADDAIIDFGV